MGTRRITGPARHPFTNALYASAVIGVQSLAAFASDVASYPGETWYITTDAGGDFDITLGTPENGTHAYVWRLPNCPPITLNIDTGPDITLHELIMAATPVTDPSGLATEIAARIAADLVLQANIDAEALARAAADSALSSALSAHTALTSSAHGGIVPSARLLTINGTALDLSADRSWTVGDVLSSGSYSDPAWITSLAWPKVSGTPTTLAGYGITDAQPLDADLTAIASFSGTGFAVRRAANVWAQRSITGTTNRLSVTNGDGVTANPTLDISTSYAGQSSITTLGTILSGTWQADIVAPLYGGSGVANTGNLAWPSGGGTAALLGVANTFTLGPNSFRAGADGNVALSARRNSSGATANIFEVQDESGTALAYTNVSGGMLLKGHSAIGASAAIDSDSPLASGSTFSTALVAAEEMTVGGTKQRIAFGAYLKFNPVSSAPGNTFAINANVETTAGNVQTHGSNLIAIFGQALHKNAMTIPNVRGLHYFASNEGGATTTGIHGLFIEVQNKASGATTTMAGLETNLYNSGGATTTNAYGVKITAPLNSATITNNYGLQIANITGGVTLNYAIFTAGGQVRHETGAAAVIGQVIKGFTSQSANLQEWWDVNSNVLGSVSSIGAALFRPRDAATATVTTALTIGHASSGTPAASYGVEHLFTLQSSTTADRSAAAWDALWGTATDASRKARIVGNVYDTAAREWIRGEASGSAAMIGFLGAAAVVRQTLGAAATDAATTQTLANNLRTALINLGLGQT